MKTILKILRAIGAVTLGIAIMILCGFGFIACLASIMGVMIIELPCLGFAFGAMLAASPFVEDDIFKS